MSDKVKYPNITVKLTGKDGNAFSILGEMTKALKLADVPAEEIEEFKKKALSGNYNDLLILCMETVNVR